MRTKMILFTAIILLLGLAGCEKENSIEKVQLKDFSYLGCKDDVKDTRKKVKQIGETEYIEYKATADGYLSIKHVNSVFNCCPDTIKTNAAVEGNSISIVESEAGPKCDCICGYDLAYMIGPLSNGKYTLIFSRDTHEFLRFTINYNSSLRGKIIVQN